MIIGIIQARTNSSRLPKKVLKLINRKSVLEYMLERVLQSKKLEKIIVATTQKEEDDEIVNICKKCGIDYYRGSEDDVLERFKMASDEKNSKIIVRLNSDCPLIDGSLIDCTIKEFLKNEYDYVSTIFPKKGTYPEGMSVEVFSKKLLDIAYTESKKPSEREHVTPFIWRNISRFRLKRIEYERDLSKYRFCLDYQEDFELIKKVIEGLYIQKPNFKLEDLIEWIDDKPDVFRLNSNIQDDAGWIKSLEQDKKSGFE